jgi:para-aminobenzoate synthetase component 1
LAKLKIFKKELNYIEPSVLFNTFYKGENSIWLDSSLHNKFGRYSIMAFDADTIFKSTGENIEIEYKDVKTNKKGNPILEFYKLFEENKAENATQLPFGAGALGYLSYDLAWQIEKLPDLAKKQIDIPDIYFCFYSWAFIYDHLENRLFLTYIDGKVDVDYIFSKLPDKKEFTPAKVYSSKLDSCFNKEEYIKLVKRIKDYIKEGDIYQANLSNRYFCKIFSSPIEVYYRLRELNPAPFSAFLDFGDFHVLSSSPERFILTKDKYIETRPIKGTRKKGSNITENECLKTELLNSVKDRAELLMIIDLERNDLGKICKAGSVKVPQLYTVEEYATVNHLVSTVTGNLCDDIGINEIIKAVFPGGSITGAPKIRAMEIIEELEMYKRNVYTGSIGYISYCGDMDMNIAIRTIVINKNMAFYNVGGGIIWDSVPEDEYYETLYKGQALYKTLGGE